MSETQFQKNAFAHHFKDHSARQAFLELITDVYQADILENYTPSRLYSRLLRGWDEGFHDMYSDVQSENPLYKFSSVDSFVPRNGGFAHYMFRPDVSHLIMQPRKDILHRYGLPHTIVHRPRRAGVIDLRAGQRTSKNIWVGR